MSEDRRNPSDASLVLQHLLKQDEAIADLRKLIVEHLADERDIGPALRELVGLWRASKLLGVVATGLAAAVASMWAAGVWIKDHVRL